jgi:hypothetical protein
MLLISATSVLQRAVSSQTALLLKPVFRAVGGEARRAADRLEAISKDIRRLRRRNKIMNECPFF